MNVHKNKNKINYSDYFEITVYVSTYSDQVELNMRITNDTYADLDSDEM